VHQLGNKVSENIYMLVYFQGSAYQICNFS